MAKHSEHEKSTKVTTTMLIVTIGGNLLLCGLAFGYFKYHEKILTVPNLPSAVGKYPKDLFQCFHSFSESLDRLVYTLRLQVFNLIPFWFLLHYVIHQRIHSAAINPLSGNEHLIEKGNNILRNTHEQLMFAFLNHLILATYLPPEYLYFIPFLVFFFVLGRTLFFLGYRIHPMYRNPGMMGTLLPPTLAFFANIAYATGLAQYIKFLPPASGLF